MPAQQLGRDSLKRLWVRRLWPLDKAGNLTPIQRKGRITQTRLMRKPLPATTPLVVRILPVDLLMLPVQAPAVPAQLILQTKIGIQVDRGHLEAPLRRHLVGGQLSV